MANEFRLLQSQTQKLILSPQMRLYLKLLTLPLLELRELIERELAENPSLEEEPQTSPSESAEEAEQATAPANSEESSVDTTVDRLSELDEEAQESEDQIVERDQIPGLQRKRQYRESLISKQKTLGDYLLWQVGFLNLNENQLLIAQHVVGNVDDNGFLTCSPEEIAQATGQPLSEVQSVLTVVQSLDPPGVCAQNVQEALLLQLDRLDKEGKEVHLAQTIVRNHLNQLERKQFDYIAKASDVTVEQVKEASQVIGRLDPKPGRSFYQEESTAVTPDAAVWPNENEPGQFQIEIFDEPLPHLRISNDFRRLLKNRKTDEKTKQFIRAKIQSGMWLLRAIEQRKITLRGITEAIVKAQSEFFEKGFAYLKPLRLKDIAQIIGIHESTVSRAIAGKYIYTPQGTIPYKSLFSTKLETESGGSESQKSIMEKIKAIIQQEDPKKPLSDSEIVQLLHEEGIKVARRTVAKYRDLLKILPTHLRKQR